MSTQPTDDESPPPTPTPQRSEGGPIPSCELDRRTFLRGTAAAGAVAIGAGTASASTGIGAHWSDENWHEYDGDNADVSDRTHGVLDWHEYENDEPSADATNLHLQIQNEGEWFDDHDTVLDNHYQDMHTIAHIDARNGITNEWEDGGGQSEGYDAALDAIEDYWAIHEQNDINAGLRVLTNFAHFCDAAQANDDVADALLTLHCGDWSGGDTHVLGVVTADFQTAEFELLNGAMFETRVPRIEFYEPVEDDEAGEKVGETLLTPAILQNAEGDDWWDTEFTFEDVNDDGDTITTSGSWNLQNLPDYDDSEFPGVSGVFEMGYWYQQFARHDGQAATVQANYDEALVGEIYDALDDGEISPSDVRSSVGMARHMGGTDDALADSFRIALLMQLGIEQPDLEGVASMTVSYSGATGRNVIREDNTRNVYPDEFVEDREAEGLLYARETPEQGYVTGETLAADPHYFVTVDDEVLALDSAGNTKWKTDFFNGADIAVGPDRDLVFLSNFDNVRVIDAHTGEEIETLSGAQTAVSISPDGDMVLVGRADEVALYDTETWSEEWTASISNDGEDAAFYPDGSAVAVNVSGYVDDNVVALNTDDGSEKWSYTTNADNAGIGVTPDGEMVVTADDSGASGLDAETGGEEWSYSGMTSDDIRHASLSPDGQRFVLCDAGDEVGLIDTTDGSEIDNTGAYSPRAVGFSTGSNHALVGTDDGRLVKLDADDGSEQFNEEVANDRLEHPIEHGYQSHALDGELTGAIFYDATESEELQLTSGVVEIVEQVDADGEEVESSDTNTPEYDTNDVTEYTETVEKHTTVYEETIVNNYDTGDGGGDWWPSVSGPDFDEFGGQLAGMVVIAALVVTVIWSVVSDVIPFLGN